MILNKKKTKSLKVVERLGFIKFGYQRKFVLDLQKLSFYLNRGCILKNSVKKLIYLMTLCV